MRQDILTPKCLDSIYFMKMDIQYQKIPFSRDSFLLFSLYFLRTVHNRNLFQAMQIYKYDVGIRKFSYERIIILSNPNLLCEFLFDTDMRFFESKQHKFVQVIS